MSYPQPNLSQQIARGGANYWRLYTQITGPGDVYEIPVPASAVALGPDSDVAQVGLTIFDDAVPTISLSTIRVTPQFAAPIAVTPRVETNYPISPGRPGRMLAWLIDTCAIFQYLPVGYDVTKMFLSAVPPRLDLIGWQGQPPAIPTRRGDRQFLFQTHNGNIGANGGIWRIFPTFGRKYTFVDLFNNSGVTVTYEVRGVNFSTVNNPNPLAAGPRNDEETSLVASVGVGTGTGNKKVITAAANGVFDAIAVFMSTVGGGTISNAPLRVITSDDPE